MKFLSTLATVVAYLSLVDARAIEQRQTLSFDYNSDKVRGVNLGGWFVLEPFITPSIFAQWADGGEVVDEYTFCEALGGAEALSRLQAHWNTWITEPDFQAIANAGLNHVRIPIGYWALAPQPGDPYVQGQLDVLDQAIGWARTAGLKVLLDLHGAPGSQNGFDNSGRRGSINWQSGNNVEITLTAIQNLADRYASNTDVVTAIELLNEPLGPDLNMDDIKQFYYDGWGNVRSDNGQTAVVIHDAFQDIDSYWNGFMNQQSGVNNVILDHHDYEIFADDQVGMSISQHISTACSIGDKVKGTDKWLVVGEWTAALTDCAKWLNGLGIGARYDGTYSGSPYVGSCDGKYEGTAAGLSATDKTNMRMFVEAQMDAFEQHTGWIFWTWKTESAPEWDLQDLLSNGLFPQPLDSREYSGQCSF